MDGRNSIKQANRRASLPVNGRKSIKKRRKARKVGEKPRSQKSKSQPGRIIASGSAFGVTASSPDAVSLDNTPAEDSDSSGHRFRKLKNGKKNISSRQKTISTLVTTMPNQPIQRLKMTTRTVNLPHFASMPKSSLEHFSNEKIDTNLNSNTPSLQNIDGLSHSFNNFYLTSGSADSHLPQLCRSDRQTEKAKAEKNESLRWDSPCDDPEEELERIRIYKMNRRKRYLAAAQAKGIRLTCASMSNCSINVHPLENNNSSSLYYIPEISLSQSMGTYNSTMKMVVGAV